MTTIGRRTAANALNNNNDNNISDKVDSAIIKLCISSDHSTHAMTQLGAPGGSWFVELIALKMPVLHFIYNNTSEGRYSSSIGVDPDTADTCAAARANSRRTQRMWLAGVRRGGSLNLDHTRDVCKSIHSAPFLTRPPRHSNCIKTTRNIETKCS